MKINEKDRGQLLRMAGNIASSLAFNIGEVAVADYDEQTEWIADTSAMIAIATLRAVDSAIEATHD